MDNQKQLAFMLKRSTIIHLALTASVLMCGVLLMVVARLEENPFSQDLDDQPYLIHIYVLAGILSLVGAYVVPGLVVRADAKPPEGRDPETLQMWAVNRFLLFFLLRGALIESVAVLGVVQGALGLRLDIAYAFLAVSLAAILTSWPTQRIYEERFAPKEH